MKKFVVRLELQEAEDKRRALKTVSTLSGIDEIAIDMKGKKLTIVGTVDPVSVVSKLRKKNWTADIISVGPAKEEPKKEEPKKEEPKKEVPKKEEAKKEEPAKKEDQEQAKKEEPKKEEQAAKKEEPKKEEEAKKEGEMKKEEMIKMIEQPPQLMYRTVMPYKPYYPPPNTYYYQANHYSMEENPNACIII